MKKKTILFLLFIFSAFIFVGCGDNSDDKKCEEHTWEISEEISKATCHSSGITGYKCKNCGVTKTEAVPQLQHEYSDYHYKYDYHKPTSYMEGYLTKTCKNCGGEEGSITLPSFLDENGNLRDCYKVEKINESDQFSCKKYIDVKFVYKNAPSGVSKELVTFNTQYKGPHTYKTENYLFSEVNHYSICSECGEYDKNSKEAHSLTDGKCSCGYVDLEFTYKEETNKVSISYTGNAENVVIPALYEVNGQVKKVNAIKEIINVDNGIKSLTIPNTITSIYLNYKSKLYSLENVYYNGDWTDWCGIDFRENIDNPMAFASNFYMLDDQNTWKKVENIVLPEGITKIWRNSFEGFKAESITLPSTLKELGYNAFGCDYVWEEDNNNMWWPISTGKSFENIYYPGTLEQYLSIQMFETHYTSPYQGTDNFYIKDSNGQYTEVFELVIPENITSIYQHFAYNEELTKVTISGNTIIGQKAFAGCTSLSVVTISKNCVQINPEAFAETSIDIVNYDGTLEDWFKIEFGSGLANPLYKESGDVEFNISGLYQKNSYVVPDTVFQGSYTELHSSFVVVPSSITEVKPFAFYGYRDEYLLQGRDNGYFLVIENGVTTIGNNAFAGCTISSVFIPKSVTKISNSAFSNTFKDDTLHVIYYEGTKAEWEALAGTVDIGKAEVYFYNEQATGLLDNNHYWYYDENGYVYECYQGVSSLNKVASIKYNETLED